MPNDKPMLERWIGEGREGFECPHCERQIPLELLAHLAGKLLALQRKNRGGNPRGRRTKCGDCGLEFRSFRAFMLHRQTCRYR